MTTPHHSQPLEIVSLFSGCGGLDLGFVRRGHKVIYACDSSKHAVACYRWNIGDHCVKRDVTSDEYTSDLGQLDTADVVLGGFPCQGFSKAGPKRQDDKRNLLYERMQSTVLTLKPKVFVAENVDGIQQNFGGEFVRRVSSGFTDDSTCYKVHYQVLDAAHYGVPQHRRRAFFIGIRTDIESSQGTSFHWPLNTHENRTRNGEFKVNHLPLFRAGRREQLGAPVTVRDAIGDLTKLSARTPDHQVIKRWPSKYAHVFRAIGPGQKLCNVRHAETSIYTWHIPEAFGETTDVQRLILDTIGRYRRHKKYGSIPNGNPLPVDEIARLTDLSPDVVATESNILVVAGYLKPKLDGFDLKGAMFCSGLFKRPKWDEPGPTVLTNFHNPRYFLHPSENRPLSLRECARLQSFDDDFQFLAAGVSLVEGYRLVGNAVPPLLSGVIAQAVDAVLLPMSKRQSA